MSESERLMDMEIRMTYLESTLQQLNDVVVRQQDQIDVLTLQLRRLSEQVRAQAEVVAPMSQETPPPHY